MARSPKPLYVLRFQCSPADLDHPDPQRPGHGEWRKLWTFHNELPGAEWKEIYGTRPT